MRAILTILRFVALTAVALPLAASGWLLVKAALALTAAAEWIQENA